MINESVRLVAVRPLPAPVQAPSVTSMHLSYSSHHRDNRIPRQLLMTLPLQSQITLWESAGLAANLQLNLNVQNKCTNLNEIHSEISLQTMNPSHGIVPILILKVLS